MKSFLVRGHRLPQTPRWALYEVAKHSSHQRSPDHDFYAFVEARHDGKTAAISVARKLARRSYHVPREVAPGPGLRLLLPSSAPPHGR